MTHECKTCKNNPLYSKDQSPACSGSFCPLGAGASRLGSRRAGWRWRSGSTLSLDSLHCSPGRGPGWISLRPLAEASLVYSTTSSSLAGNTRFSASVPCHLSTANPRTYSRQPGSNWSDRFTNPVTGLLLAQSAVGRRVAACSRAGIQPAGHCFKWRFHAHQSRDSQPVDLARSSASTPARQPFWMERYFAFPAEHSPDLSIRSVTSAKGISLPDRFQYWRRANQRRSFLVDGDARHPFTTLIEDSER